MGSINSLSPKTLQTLDLKIFTLLFLAILNCDIIILTQSIIINSPTAKDLAKTNFES